jgi:hypothetical protein
VGEDGFSVEGLFLVHEMMVWGLVYRKLNKGGRIYMQLVEDADDDEEAICG